MMDDMPVIEIMATPTAVPVDWFAKYKSLRREFMKSLSDDSIQELSFLNFSRDEFMHLIMGVALPENLSIRFRVPLQFGGKLEIENIFACKTFPHAMELDRFIMEQAGAATLWLPNPVKKIYVPAHTAEGTAGGNATSDRLAQMAAQLADNRGLE